MNKSRQPNKEEIRDLIKLLIKNHYVSIPSIEEVKNLERLVHEAYIAVFDNYITDGPGYAGKVMTVVWSGSPSIYEVFTWDRYGNIRHENQDEGLRYKDKSERV